MIKIGMFLFYFFLLFPFISYSENLLIDFLYDENLFEEAQDVLYGGSEWNGKTYNEILFYLALSEYELGNYNKMRESLYAMDPACDVAFFY